MLVLRRALDLNRLHISREWCQTWNDDCVTAIIIILNAELSSTASEERDTTAYSILPSLRRSEVHGRSYNRTSMALAECASRSLHCDRLTGDSNPYVPLSALQAESSFHSAIVPDGKAPCSAVRNGQWGISLWKIDFE